MGYIQAIKFIIITIIVISVITYITTISLQNKSYRAEIIQLSTQISNANQAIENQNSKIQELEINIQEKQKIYEQAKYDIEKYKQERLFKSQALIENNATCEERMNYILFLQQEFQGEMREELRGERR